MKNKLLFLLSVLSFGTFGQAPDYAWVNISNGVTNPYVSTGINSHFTAVDKVNNYIYCVSGFEGSINFGDGEHESSFNSGQPSLYLVKYTLDGNLVWAKSFYNTHSNNPSGLVIDNSGNIIISGNSTGDSVTFDNQFLLNGYPDNTDHPISYIVKLDQNGNTQWLQGSSADGGGVNTSCLTVDQNGNIYASGIVYDPVGTFCGNNISSGFFVIKLNGSGTSQWLQQGSANYSEGMSIVTDSNNDCIIVGRHANTFTLGTHTVAYNDGSTYYDRFLTKISSSGIYQWVVATGLWQGPEIPYSVELDNMDNIYISGMDVYAPDPMAAGYQDWSFLEKRDSNGNPIWYKHYEADGNNTVYPTALTDHRTTENGDTYALFIVNDTTDFDGTLVASNAAYMNTGIIAVVAKYDQSGNQTWVKTTLDNNYLCIAGVFGISLDEAENVYYTGFLSGSINFDNITKATQDPNYKEFLLAKLGDEPVGISEIDLSSLLAYPNPAKTMLYLKNADQNTEYSIVDQSGRTVLKGKGNSLNVSELNSGVYMVQTFLNQSLMQIKFVKE